MGDILNFSGGINQHDPAYEIKEGQCLVLQNMRYRHEIAESIRGTIRHHPTSMGSNPVTCIMPYSNEETGDYKLLVACGDSIYLRDSVTGAMTALKSGLTPDSIYSSADRYSVKYIASEAEPLTKYIGHQKIESVGGGTSAPGAFRQVIYMKEIDRLFGIRSSAVLGQIAWCELGNPESWPAENVMRIKLEQGEEVEWAEILYGKLIIFTTYNIWILYCSGNEENWKLEQAPTTVGTVAFKTVKKVGTEIWFLGESPSNVIGVYAFNGSSVRFLTHDILHLLQDINRPAMKKCCAEVHDSMYTLSYPEGGSYINNRSIDLDMIVLKDDGMPAVWGPHDIAFYSSAVLDGKVNSMEWLMGDETDGFVYKYHGNTLKSTNGADGGLLRRRILTGVYNDGKWDVMKRFNSIRCFFSPTGFFQAHLKAYLSYGFNPTSFQNYFHAQASGDFDVWERTLYGAPDLFEHIQPLGAGDRGVSIQLEIICDNLGQSMSVKGFSYDATPLYKTKKVQSYAL